jgi:hypothetical protein
VNGNKILKKNQMNSWTFKRRNLKIPGSLGVDDAVKDTSHDAEARRILPPPTQAALFEAFG